MSRSWKIVAWVWGVFWTFVLVAATVPAKQAVSNLSSWSDTLGLTYLAHVFATKGADYLAQGIGAASLLLAGWTVYDSYMLKKKIDELNRRLIEMNIPPPSD